MAETRSNAGYLSATGIGGEWRADVIRRRHADAPIPLEQVGRLQDAVDELQTLYEIDILDLNATGPVLREEILKHGERL